METFLIFSISDFNNTCINLKFVDSYKHLTSSLDGLVNSLLNKDANIQSIKNKFAPLFQYFKDDAKKIIREGVFPYNYMDEEWRNKLKEKKSPDIKYFNSSLNNTKCLVHDYNYALRNYDDFNKCKEINDDNDLYVKTHVLLLADVFTSYRKDSYSSFGLDSLYCVSAPSFF